MALIHAEPTDDMDGSITAEYERESKYLWLMWFDAADDVNYVRSHCGFVVGSRHPIDRQQVLLKISCACKGTAGCDAVDTAALLKMWEVSIEYGPWNPAERGDPAEAGNPLAMPPRWRLEWEKVPEPLWTDEEDGAPIVNTAGDPFDPPVERDNLIGILTVRRNEAQPNFSALLSLSNSVNVAPWLIFGEKCARLAPVAIPELEYSQEAQIFFYPMVYVIEINLRDWRKRILNAGYRQQKSKLANVRNLEVINDDAGSPLQTPGMLDREGAYLHPPVTKDQIVIAVFDVHPAKDFSALGLDKLFQPPAVLS